MLLFFHCSGAAAAAPISLLFSHSSFPPSPSVSFSFFPFQQSRRTAHIALARRGLASRTRRLEKRDKERGEADDEALVKEEGMLVSSIEFGGEGEGGGEVIYSTGPPPALPGLEKNFWEGPQWDALGFFVQYMWAFGILFGVIACGIAVATYNEGATDFKQTTVYKESIQSRELLEQPDGSDADVFEGNPTEVAPSLE